MVTTRRAWMRAAAALGASICFAGCASAAAAAGVAAALDFAGFAQELDGVLLLPRDAAFARAKRTRNARFDDVTPRAIVQAQTVADVQRALRLARENGVHLVVRGGGHSYVGASVCDGIVLDLRAMRDVMVDAAAQTVRAGPGNTNLDIAAAAQTAGLAVPLGTCPTVGIVGLTLGGGKGYSSRMLGLTCDSLLEVEIVLASGDVARCSASHEPDLFWACRGGGGGTFGVVTSLLFRAHPVGVTSSFQLDWRLGDAARAWQQWQRIALTAPDHLFVRFELGRDSTTRVVRWYGQCFGPREDARALLAPFLDDKALAHLDLAEGSWLDATRRFAGCGSQSMDACRAANAAEPDEDARGGFAAKSEYFAQPLADDVVDDVLRVFEASHEDVPAWDGLVLDPGGGAIARIARTDTAFVHRDAAWNAEVYSFWPPNTERRRVRARRRWLRAMRDVLTPHATGETYQNYLDDERATWAVDAFAENLPRLQSIKQRVDAAGFLRGSQIIAPRA